MNAWRTIASRAVAGVWRGALGWAFVFAATVASSAFSYVSTFPDASSRARLAASLHGDGGVSMLLGPISGVGTVGGYTNYKTFVFLTTLGAVWALLAATRLLRGEEDANRWHLLVSGPIGPTGATTATLVALVGAVVLVGVGGGVGALAAGSNPEVGFTVSECIGYAASLIAPMVTFAAVGALTSQLARSRRLASEIGLGVVAFSFVVRMVADSGPDTRWLLWATPFGWSERVRALQDTAVAPIVVAGVVSVVIGASAIAMSARRDVGAGVWSSRDVAETRNHGLGSVWGFIARLQFGSLIGWFVGIVGGAVALGLVARLTTSVPGDSMTNLMARFGMHGSFQREYFGISFLLLATVLALLPAGIFGDAASDEREGRTVHVVVRTPRRSTLLLASVVVAVTAVTVTAVAAGVTAYGVAAGQGVAVSFGSMMVGALNMVPVGLVAIAFGTFLLAVAPRFAAPAVYFVVIWSFVADLLASMVSGLAGLRHLSIFNAMALAPAEPVDVAAAIIMVTGALLVVGVSVVVYARRDLAVG